MHKYIKLHIFVSKEDSGLPEDKTVTTWVRDDSILMIQEVNVETVGFKSYISVKGIDEGLKVIETASEIITAAERLSKDYLSENR